MINAIRLADLEHTLEIVAAAALSPRVDVGLVGPAARCQVGFGELDHRRRESDLGEDLLLPGVPCREQVGGVP